MMILAAGGYVSPEAEAALLRGLEMEPRNGTARYYAGLMYAQQGRPDLAFPIWRNLMAESTRTRPGSTRSGSRSRRSRRWRATRAPRRPAAAASVPAPGPSPEQMEAASEMAPEDRAAMIEGMVAGLADRLATEGGPPEDWARLITAFGVLGRGEQAQAVYDEALAVFAEDPAALEQIEAAGRTLREAAE
jgi:cytochrome c-type biogenesis protein CcmH